IGPMCSSKGPSPPLEAERLDQRVEMRPSDIEMPRCGRHVPVEAPERPGDELGLEATRRLVERRCRIARPSVLGAGAAAAKHLAALDDERALGGGADARGLDGVLELTDVSGPVREGQGLLESRRQTELRKAVTGARARAEVARERDH